LIFVAESYFSSRFVSNPQMPVLMKCVRKAYGKKTVLDGIDFEINPGEAVCVLGSNASGKSTLIKIITGLIYPTSGLIKIFGLSPFMNKSRIGAKIGYVPQHLNVFDEMSVKYNLEFFCKIFGAPSSRVKELMSQFELTEFAHTPVASLSGGYQRRINLACSLVHDPDFVIMDEPEAGLDPRAREKIWEFVECLKSAGKSILLVTHSVADATRLCDRVYFFHRGRIVSQGSPSELISRISRDTLIDIKLRPCPQENVAEAIKGIRGTGNVFVIGEAVLIEAGLDDAVRILGELPKALGKSGGYKVTEMSIHDPTLEDVFLVECGEAMLG